MHERDPVDRAGLGRLAVPLHARPPHPAALRRRAGDRADRVGALGARGFARFSGRAAGGRTAAGRGSSSCSAPASCCSRRSRSSSSRCCGDPPGWSRPWRSPRCCRWRCCQRRRRTNDDHAAVAGRRRARRAAGAQLLRPDRPRRRSTAAPRNRSFTRVLVFSPILCAGLLFGSAIARSTDADARLRHQPAGRHGRRRRRVSLARHRLPRPAPRDRDLLSGGGRFTGTGAATRELAISSQQSAISYQFSSRPSGFSTLELHRAPAAIHNAMK